MKLKFVGINGRMVLSIGVTVLFGACSVGNEIETVGNASAVQSGTITTASNSPTDSPTGNPPASGNSSPEGSGSTTASNPNPNPPSTPPSAGNGDGRTCDGDDDGHGDVNSNECPAALNFAVAFKSSCAEPGENCSFKSLGVKKTPLVWVKLLQEAQMVLGRGAGWGNVVYSISRVDQPEKVVFVRGEFIPSGKVLAALYSLYPTCHFSFHP